MQLQLLNRPLAMQLHKLKLRQFKEGLLLLKLLLREILLWPKLLRKLPLVLPHTTHQALQPPMHRVLYMCKEEDRHLLPCNLDTRHLQCKLGTSHLQRKLGTSHLLAPPVNLLRHHPHLEMLCQTQVGMLQ